MDQAKMGAEIETLQAWLDKLEADVSVHLHTMRAQLEDLRALKTAADLSEIIDKLREKLEEASPETKEQLEAESRTPGMA